MSPVFSKVWAAILSALVVGGAAALDHAGATDWVSVLGPWAAPVGAVVTAFAAWYRTETVGFYRDAPADVMVGE